MKLEWVRHGSTVLAAGVLLAAAGVEGAAAQISVVVAASSNITGTKSEVIDMFVGARTTWSNGAKVQVVDQPDTDVGRKFYADVLGQTVPQLRTQWTRLVLSGQAQAPKKAPDAGAVKRVVSQTPGAIGYIPTSDLDASVKEILKI